MQPHAKLTAKSKEKSSEGEGEAQGLQSALSAGGNAVLDLIVLTMARDQLAHWSVESMDGPGAQGFIILPLAPVKKQGVCQTPGLVQT